MSSSRTIDQRFLPPVAGVDLAQSLNFLALPDVGEAFIYDNYTSSRLPYRPASRPRLETVIQDLDIASASPIELVQALASYVANEVPWAGFYQQKAGRRLPADRALTEEAIVESGFGWCNEQARLFCALTQIAGLPSRLVFASNQESGYGHVTSEVLLPSGWLAVDQSFGYLFLKDSQPVRAADIWQNEACRAYFTPIYRQLCHDLEAKLGREVLDSGFRMAIAENPLDGFKDLGYHNHFVY